VTDRDIERVVRENRLKTIEDVTDYIKPEAARQMPRPHPGDHRQRAGARLVPIKPKVLTNLQKIKLIEESIEREINPAWKKDAGDWSSWTWTQPVIVRLGGTCATCAKSHITLKH